MTGQALLTLESQSQKVLGLLCAELYCNAFSSIARWRKHYRPDFTELVLESTLTCSSQDWDISALSDSDTDNHSDDVTCTNFAQWLTVQTVNLLYQYSTGLQGVRVGHDKQSHPTWTHFPTVVFWQHTNGNKSCHEPATKTWHKPQQTLAYAIKENSVPCMFRQKQTSAT